MSQQGPQPPPPPPEGSGPGGRGPSPSPGWPKWSLYVLLAAFLGIIILAVSSGGSTGTEISYSEFRDKMNDGKVASIEFDNASAKITGEYENGKEFRTTGFREAPQEIISLAAENGVDLTPKKLKG
jgi:ATP-dependent Zn protease